MAHNFVTKTLMLTAIAPNETRRLATTIRF